MRAIADATIALADLFEAEGRALRGSLIKIAIGIVLVLIGGLALIGSCAMLIWSLYLFLLTVAGFPAPLAALIDAGAVLIIGGAMIWGGMRLNR